VDSTDEFRRKLQFDSLRMDPLSHRSPGTDGPRFRFRSAAEASRAISIRKSATVLRLRSGSHRADPSPNRWAQPPVRHPMDR
jgi:hypothetical protein